MLSGDAKVLAFVPLDSRRQDQSRRECPLPPSFSAPRQGCRESRVFDAANDEVWRQHLAWPQPVSPLTKARYTIHQPRLIFGGSAQVVAFVPLDSRRQDQSRRECPLPPSFSAPRQGCRESRLFDAANDEVRRQRLAWPQPVSPLSKAGYTIHRPRLMLSGDAKVLAFVPLDSRRQDQSRRECPLPPSFSAPRQGCRESRVFDAANDEVRRQHLAWPQPVSPLTKAGYTIHRPRLMLSGDAKVVTFVSLDSRRQDHRRWGSPSPRHSRHPARGVGNPESLMPRMTR